LTDDESSILSRQALEQNTDLEMERLKMSQAKMTPLQATHFEHGKSIASATILAGAAESRGCSCEAYKDWFTYRRWQTLGYQVQKGEKSTKLIAYPKVVDKNTGKEKSIRRTTCLFCRCQVKPIER
jgi:hypothetical protein